MDAPGAERNLRTLDKSLPEQYQIVPVVARQAKNVKVVTQVLRSMVE